MKRLPAIAFIAFSSLFFVGCQSERDRKIEICAQYWAQILRNNTNEEAESIYVSTYKKLGIKYSKWPDNLFEFSSQISNYCAYYLN